MQGPRLLGNVGIRAAIVEGTKQQLDKVGLTAEITKEAIRRHVVSDARGDIRKLFDEKGNVRPIVELDDAEALMIGPSAPGELFSSRPLPIRRIVGPEAMKFGWQRLNSEYAKQFAATELGS